MNEHQKTILREEIARYSPRSIRVPKPELTITKDEIRIALGLQERQAFAVLERMAESGEWQRVYVEGDRRSHLIPISDAAKETARKIQLSEKENSE